MNHLEREILQRVVKARKEMGLDQYELGRALGLSKQGYNAYETSNVAFTIEQLFQLSRILGKPVTYFLGLDAPLGEERAELLTAYDRLSDAGRDQVLWFAKKLYEMYPRKEEKQEKGGEKA